MKFGLKIAWAAFALAAACSFSAEPAPEPPPKVAYVASTKSIPFHLPSCIWARRILPENLQTFQTRAEAVKAGHRPCKVCKP